MSPRDQAHEAQLAAAIARCAGGDRTAFRLIYDLEAARMIGVAVRIVRRRELAEEAVHDALVNIWRAARSFDPSKGDALPWIYAIVRNRALSILRDEKRFVADEDMAERSAEPDVDDAVSRLPEAGRLRRCLELLDVKRRDAVVLAYVHGMSHGEIAGKLSVPLGTAKSWTRRGLMSLQECMR
jgi:RNA polymerase sigma-70 factor (ECF subfamily)